MTSNSIARTRWAAVGAAVAVTLGAVGIGSLNIANADVSTGDRPIFVSINPCRLLDTRPGDLNVGPQTAPIGASETVTVTAHGANGECTGPSTIPTDALSLSLNVTAVGPTANTFLTFWGEGDNPGTSNLNPRAGGAPTPNSVNTPLSPAGTFNIFNNAGNVNVIVDVNGYYANHNHDDRYYTETEVDAAITAAVEAAAVEAATAYPETLRIGAADFSKSEGLEGASNRGQLAFADSATECFIASIPTPPTARTITSVDVLYESQSAEADLDVDVFRAPSTIGNDAVFTSVVSAELEISGAPVGMRLQLQSEPVPVDVDAQLLPDESHTLLVCGNDAIDVYGVVIESTD